MTDARVRRVPVVSVGNLAMGGRGKTPVAAYVAQRLVDRGERPAILSRGYRRPDPTDQVVVVSDGRHRLADLDRSGDEPLLLARQVPGAAVLVHPVRARAAAFAQAHLGATVHVLDDGFQHRSMERDIDIVIIRIEDLTDRRIPFGRLRSSVRALANAHAVVVEGVSLAEARTHLAHVLDAERTSVFTMARSIGTPWRVEGTGPPFDPRQGSVVALAAIASPERFVRALESAGWTVASLVAFPDHHTFTRRDLERVAREEQRTGAVAVATTEKDAMRLLPLRPIGLSVVVAPLEITIEPREAFAAWLDGQLARVGAWPA